MIRAALPIAWALITTAAQAGEWHVDTEHADNRVQFTSEVVALSFDGVTRNIDGYMYWEGEELFERKSQFFFEVDMASFDTGIGKRDRDMREVLNTRKWPKAHFEGTIAAHAPDTSAAHSYTALAKGIFSLHGVERPIEIPAAIAVGDTHSLVAADFTIRLQDYGIEAPSLAAFIKVSEMVDVSVHFRMRHIAQKKE